MKAQTLTTQGFEFSISFFSNSNKMKGDAMINITLSELMYDHIYTFNIMKKRHYEQVFNNRVREIRISIIAAKSMITKPKKK